jgi:hypothetical protein
MGLQPGNVIMFISEIKQLTLFRLAWRKNLATRNANAGG